MKELYQSKRLLVNNIFWMTSQIFDLLDSFVIWHFFGKTQKYAGIGEWTCYNAI